MKKAQLPLIAELDLGDTEDSTVNPACKCDCIGNKQYTCAAHARAPAPTTALTSEKVGCVTGASNGRIVEKLEESNAPSVSSGCDLHRQVGEWRPRFATCLSSTVKYGFVESHLCDECFGIAKHFSDPFLGIFHALKNVVWEA